MALNSPAIAAGRLRTAITIEAPATRPDSFGQPSISWLLVLVTRGEIVEATAAEKFAAGHFTSQVTHTVTTRYRAGITAGMRARTAGGVYLIQAVANVDERGRLLKMLTLALPASEV